MAGDSLNILKKTLRVSSTLVLLVAVASSFFTANQAINVVKAESSVTWSDDALLYNNTVLPCVMDNAVKMGMPAFVKARATCVIVKCTEFIANGTDRVVDILDIRVAFASYMYAGMEYDEEYSCNYLYKCETGENVTDGVNCLEGTGIQTVNCTEVWSWVHSHADPVNEALQAACQTCDAAPPVRPVIPEFPSILALLAFTFGAGVMILLCRRVAKNKFNLSVD
jgi:hypothetical protein